MILIRYIFQYLCLYQITLIFFITIGTEKSLAQKYYSTSNPKQDSSRIDIGAYSFLKAPQPKSSLFSPPRGPISQNINFIGSISLVQLLEKHPELRGVILNEYIRLQITNEIKNENNNKERLRLYLIGEPTLEDDLKRMMQLYGLPYNPLRPRLLGISVSIF